MKLPTEDSISTIWMTILIWLCHLSVLTKARMTDKELHDFIKSPLGLRRLMLTVNYTQITSSEFNKVADDVLNEIKEIRGQQIHRELIESYEKLSSQFNLDFGYQCEIQDVKRTDTFHEINAISLSAWYKTPSLSNFEFCKLHEGIYCPNSGPAECKCRDGEDYDSTTQRCRVKPLYACRIPDWGDEPSEVREEVIRMLPIMISAPTDGHSPCVDGAVCKKPNLPMAVPMCVCHDTSTLACSDSTVVWKASHSNQAYDLHEDVQWFHNHAKKDAGIPCDISKTLEDKVLDAYMSYVLAKSAGLKQFEGFAKSLNGVRFCDFRRNLICEMSKKECHHSTTLCQQLYGTEFSGDECIRHSRYSFPKEDSNKLPLPFKKCFVHGDFTQQGQDFRVLDYFNLMWDSSRLCWCENEEVTKHYGPKCSKKTPFFGSRINPGIITVRNPVSYLYRVRTPVPPRSLKLDYAQNTINENLNDLEKRMNLEKDAPCNLGREKGLKEILIDTFGSILPDNLTDYTDELRFWISDLTQVATLSRLVSQVGSNDICNYKKFEVCEKQADNSDKCTTHLPQGVIEKDEYYFYFKEGYTDCSIDKFEPPLPKIFDPTRKRQKCVPDASCNEKPKEIVLKEDDCDWVTDGTKFCKCNKGFEKDGDFCKKSLKPNNFDDDQHKLWLECLRRRIKKMLKELHERQILGPEEEGCDVIKEKVVDDLDDYMDPNSDLYKIYLELVFVLTHDTFCKSNIYLNCNPNPKSRPVNYINVGDDNGSPGICQCFEGMVKTDGVCVLQDGQACGKSWKRPPSVGENSTIPVCHSRRCKLRRNGTWTCNPDPRTKIFVPYEGPVSSSSNFQFNVRTLTITIFNVIKIFKTLSLLIDLTTQDQ